MNNVLLEINSSVATLLINRPDAMNALNSETRQEITSTLIDVNENDDVRALIITGAGDNTFSAGQDITESKEFDDEDANTWIDEWDSLYAELLGMDIPVIAKLNGDAVGAAFQIALLCDMRIATDDTRLGMTEIDIGIPCITGGWIIERVSGYAAAAELTLTGELIDASRAKQLNLVNKVVPQEELDDSVDELAQKLSEKPPISMAAQKKWLRNLFVDKDMSEIMRDAQRIHSGIYNSGEPERFMTEFLDE